MLSPKCPLCEDNAQKEIIEPKHDNFQRVYYRCSNCDLYFADPKIALSHQLEQQRYQQHNNAELSEGYKNFLNNLIIPLKGFIKTNQQGLDFGSGPYPMLVEIMCRDGFQIEAYDPYFEPRKELLARKYDYITSCEVIEHFNQPLISFQLIDSLVNTEGYIAVQTSIKYESIDFNRWHYINDDTHVSFYTPKTIDWIANHFGWEIVFFKKNIVIWKK